jgi:hypothetical protein
MTSHRDAYVDGRDTDTAVQALIDLTAIVEARRSGAAHDPSITLHISHAPRLHQASGKAEDMMVNLCRRGPAVGVHVQVHLTAWAGAAA